MFIGTILTRHPDGAVTANVAYLGPVWETAFSITQMVANQCTVETTWQVQDLGDSWQFMADCLPDTLSIGEMPPTPEKKEIEENKD